MIQTAQHTRPSSSIRPRRRMLSLAVAIKLAFVSLFLFTTGGPPAVAQVDESNPAIYWRLERKRQIQKQRARKRRRVIIQRPTRLIRRARPRRGYTRAVPVNPAESNPAQQQQGDTPEAGDGDKQQTAGASPADTDKPATPPKPAIRIVVMGDNVAMQLARGLSETYQEVPQVEIVRKAHNASGLVRDDYFDWEKAAREILESDPKPDIAVMMIGSNDRQRLRDENGTYRHGTEEWKKIYAARIRTIAELFARAKIPLIWTGMPIMRNERLSADMLAFNEMYRDIVKRNGGIYVDVWEAFVDDRNRFALHGPDVNGEIVKLRRGDGVHFTNAGARKLAHFLEADIKRLIDARRDSTLPAIAVPGAPAGGQPDGPDDPKLARLPAPGEPARPATPAKPPVGPVLPLTARPRADDGRLAGPAKADKPALARRTLVKGEPPKPRTGRADDFSWPSGPGGEAGKPAASEPGDGKATSPSATN